MKNRYLSKQVSVDLSKKMVFLGGPRQVGKTTLARTFLKNKTGYLNWDVSRDREKILKQELPVSDLVIFDEIHKYKSWRNYLKGIYDDINREFKILVTGSAKLDYYRYSGDSLQGRYYYYRLHPFSVGELGITSEKDFSSLLKLGGFPEPFFSQSESEARKWSREYRNRLVREEIVSLEKVTDLGNIELLYLRLPDLVASPLSINALREDLQVSFRAVANWLNIFERVYSIFRLQPYGSPKIKAVKKEQKHYHFDWSLVKNEGARFENLVASHLLKWVHYQQDIDGRDIELNYLRDQTGKEVDFVISENKKLLYLIEVKISDTEVSPTLKYFKAKFPEAKAYQLTANSKKNFQTKDGIRVCHALEFLKELV